MLIAIRSLRIITIQEKRLLSEPRSRSQERRRYSHFLRVTSTSPSIDFTSRVPVFPGLLRYEARYEPRLWSCETRSLRAEPDFHASLSCRVSCFNLATLPPYHRRQTTRKPIRINASNETAARLPFFITRIISTSKHIIRFVLLTDQRVEEISFLSNVSRWWIPWILIKSHSVQEPVREPARRPDAVKGNPKKKKNEEGRRVQRV